MKTYWYVLNLNPVPWRVGPAGAARNATTGRTKAFIGRDAELHNYQQGIREELKKQNPVLVGGSIQVVMYFWRNQAAYTTDKKKASNQVADGTNMYKATEDACQKILFDNDRDNVSGRWDILGQGPEVEGRVIISVSELNVDKHQDDVVLEIPDEVYARAWPTASEQLLLAMNGPNLTVSSDDAKYAEAEELF